MEKVDVAKVDVDGLQATVNDTNTAVVANASSVASDPSIATDDQTKSTKSKHDYINVLFGVSLKTMKDIDDFTKGCEDGTYSVWNELESDVRTMVMEAVCGLAEAFSVETIAKSTTTKPTHESPIVQVDSMVKSRHPELTNGKPKKMMTQAIKETSRQIRYARRNKKTAKMEEKEKELRGTKANDDKDINTKCYEECHNASEEKKEEDEVDSDLESTATSRYNPN
ncbi:hypothetical protein CTI12_AA489790 [Artemisia annua]|uniref:Uncharacterized protein n=1 Tax=Artemisia annua TaxID=35608 RepID=A0A2U1LH04_ARTAN|nr:hypothetical protein CTI12_AA489790 [Artemisia annua]